LQLVGPLESPAAIRRAATDIMAAIDAAKQEGRSILPMPLMHELKAIGIDPVKGQLVDGRRFQLEEIARIYQLPPVFLQDLTNATLSNSEQQDLHFVKHTLAQWIKRWEQQLNLKLFGPRNRARFVEFNVDGLLRGDFKTRMEGYAKAIQNAINTPDEVRAMENWPAKGGDADKLHIQGATVPLGEQLQRGGLTSQISEGDGNNDD
jgi:HK97 family phage portal protein